MPQESTVQQAQQLWTAGKRNETLALLKSAAQSQADNAMAAKEYALCLLRCHFPTEGKTELRRAFQLAWPNLTQVFEVCKTAFAAHQHGLLLELLDPKAPQLAPELTYFYATALDRHSRRDDALAILTQVDPSTRIAIPYLQLLYAKLLLSDRQTKAAQAALEQVDETKLPLVFQAELHYHNAQLRQLQGETETVFQSLRRAKNILRDHPEANADHSLSSEAELSQALQQLELPTYKAPADAPAPVLLCGHPRSGTTLVEQILDRHSEITSIEEQSMFFDEVISPTYANSGKDINRAARDLIGNSSARSDYLDTMRRYVEDAGQSNCRTWIDKHPDMTSSTLAYRAIVPDGKIIVMLRDPRDVVLSCFFQNLPVNSASAAFLNLRTTAERYVQMMQLWLDAKKALDGGWLETRYEDWVADPVAESKRLFTFLELDWSEALLDPNEQEQNRVVTSPSYQDVQRPIYGTAQGRWKRYEKQLKPALSILEPICEQLGYLDSKLSPTH